MTIAQRTKTKLDPAHVKVSGKFTAILGYLFGESWTSPAITNIVETSDGLLMAAQDDDPFHNQMLGHADDLDRNLDGVAGEVGLTRQERAYLFLLRSTKIRRF